MRMCHFTCVGLLLSLVPVGACSQTLTTQRTSKPAASDLNTYGYLLHAVAVTAPCSL